MCFIFGATYVTISGMTNIHTICDIKQRNGSLKVTVEGPVFIAEFTGACSVKIAEGFYQAVKDALAVLPADGWCYLSSSKNYVAALPEVERIYTKTYSLCMQNGCMVEAYCMPSAVGLAQVDKSRKACGVDTPIKDLAFETLEDAKYFLLSTLEHIKTHRQYRATLDN